MLKNFEGPLKIKGKVKNFVNIWSNIVSAGEIYI
jgi:hypothetical protein